MSMLTVSSQVHLPTASTLAESGCWEQEDRDEKIMVLSVCSLVVRTACDRLFFSLDKTRCSQADQNEKRVAVTATAHSLPR